MTEKDLIILDLNSRVASLEHKMGALLERSDLKLDVTSYDRILISAHSQEARQLFCLFMGMQTSQEWKESKRVGEVQVQTFTSERGNTVLRVEERVEAPFFFVL